MNECSRLVATAPVALRIGISACLLGRAVRYDGGHKYHAGIVAALAAHSVLVPVCPETGCGMPVPRAPLRLYGRIAAPQMRVIETGEDWTAPMHRWIEAILGEFAESGVHGFIFKRKSPSCGLAQIPVFPLPERVSQVSPVFDEPAGTGAVPSLCRPCAQIARLSGGAESLPMERNFFEEGPERTSKGSPQAGQPIHIPTGPGLFAGAFVRRFPHIPAVEEDVFDCLDSSRIFLTQALNEARRKDY